MCMSDNSFTMLVADLSQERWPLAPKIYSLDQEWVVYELNEILETEFFSWWFLWKVTCVFKVDWNPVPCMTIKDEFWVLATIIKWKTLSIQVMSPDGQESLTSRIPLWEDQKALSSEIQRDKVIGELAPPMTDTSDNRISLRWSIEAILHHVLSKRFAKQIENNPWKLRLD